MEPNVNIIPTIPQSTVPQKSKHSPLSILFMILLTGVLIIFCEKVLYDVNKSFNPSTAENCSRSVTTQQYPSYTNCLNQDKYEANRLLIHALITLPILLGAVLLYLLYERKTGSGGHIVSWAYFGAAFWLCIRLLGEMMYYLINRYQSLGIYIVLAVFGTILTWLIVVLQRRHSLKQNLTQ